MTWEFAIDVGGTFTDCLARRPDGAVLTLKLLSTGRFKGQIARVEPPDAIIDAARSLDPDHFWIGARLHLLDPSGAPSQTRRVARFDRAAGRLQCEAPFDPLPQPGSTYELDLGEEAPIVAIRYLLGLRPDEPMPTVHVRLGTTRGTNALITRRGGRTALVTTKGFGDLLRIGTQDRPRLFDLAIRKPDPLFELAVEIDERIDAQGRVLHAPDRDAVRRQLEQVKAAGIQSLGICLMHAFAHPEHERLVAAIAREVGFDEVSVSSEVAPLEKIVWRGDTTVMDAYLNPVLRAYVAKLQQALAPSQCHGLQPVNSPDRLQARFSDLAHATSHAFATPAASSLKIMTSAGGLVESARFVGKDSILSGPAGGVVGYARVAQAAGFAKAIGFDMGGTSTDVSRFDGRYDLEFETEKAGVRVVAPMMAIETVAAGGGSICAFDGVKLVVGPDSAGADPGPACYGRGGPLTVTDLNVYLGKIVPERFPFPLDRAATERRLLQLAADVNRAARNEQPAQTYSPIQLAEGLLRVANANMVRPIRAISVAKGYDPAEYALVCFGGAAGQHACAIAGELRMRHILIHPYAGILSAYGISLADVRRFRERSVLRPYSEEEVQRLASVFRRLEAEARAEVLAEGVAEDRIDPPARSLDLRYRGVESVINVPAPERGSYAEAYERMHEQLYGYVHAGRPVEIVAARVEVVGHTPEPALRIKPVRPRRPTPAEWTTTYFDGSPHRAAVFLREQLQPGDRIAGPAIICEPTSTIVIDPGWRGRITERDEVLLESVGEPVRKGTSEGIARGPSGRSHSLTASTAHSPDPVMLEIFNNHFASIAEQMGITLRKTASSTNVKERLDFSCALFTAEGDLVVNAPHIPVHLGAMSETVKRIIADNPVIQPGDVFVTNDPYRGGSHLPDITLVTPVHEAGGRESARSDQTDAGRRAERRGEQPAAGRRPTSAAPRLLFFTASRAHHAEIGGIVPGSMPPFSKNLGEEGVLIRNFKLVDAGRSREDELRRLLGAGPYPSRAVADNLADIAAQAAANQTGVRGLQEMIARYSLPVVEAYMRHIQAAAAEKMRRALRKLEDLRGVRSDRLQAVTPDPLKRVTTNEASPLTLATLDSRPSTRFTDHLDDGSPIACAITIADDRATIDFTGTGPVVPGNLNANRAIVTAAVLYCFRCLIDEDVPLNSGVLQPLEIIVPEGCLLNPPEHADPAQCAAVVGGNVETSQRVVDVILGALGVAAASQGTMNNLTFGDGTFGYYETIAGGSGATPEADGADAVHTHMTNTRLTDPEVLERRYPVRLVRFAIRRGSGGPGKHRGGDGTVRELEFLQPLRVSILSERRGPYPPYGLEGGEPGALGRNLLLRAPGAAPPEALPGKTQLDVGIGDRLIIETPGGGGWGAPRPATARHAALSRR